MYGYDCSFKNRFSYAFSPPTSTTFNNFTVDEMHATNYLGHYLLTILLVPHLAPGARVIVMSSSWMWQGFHGMLTADAAGWHRGIEVSGNPALGYLTSKLALACVTRPLRRHLAGRAEVVLYTPGLTHSPESDKGNADGTSWKRLGLLGLFFGYSLSTAQGAAFMVESAFVTERPIPDAIYDHPFPREFFEHMAPQSMFEYRLGKAWELTMPSSSLLRGLYASIGPLCDEATETLLLGWTAYVTGTDYIGV